MTMKKAITAVVMSAVITSSSIVPVSATNLTNINKLSNTVVENANIQNEYTPAIISKFSALDSQNIDKYNEEYKIDKDNIKSITTNGRNSMGGPIESAVDGDVDTFWHTGKLNSNDFTNEVVIEFKENIDIDRIVYGNRRGENRGFAEAFTIYGASSNEGEFVKLTDGTYKNTQDFLEIKFNESNLKKIKFVFNKGTSNWASIAEMWFYKKDELANKMARLFTDSTFSEVSEEFNTVEKMNDLENEAKSHLLYDTYKEKLEDAKSLVLNDKVVASIAKISQFNLYDNKEYDEVFKMDNSNIKSVKNNAGNNVGKFLTYATDGDIDTAWESNKVNTDSFKNEVEVIFEEKVILDRVVYGARQSDSKGFAQEFEIYGSKTTNGDTYELITTGSYDVTKGLIEARFEPTEFKRMKFKFKKSKDNWATISEIAFYKEDKLTYKVNDIFTDNTMTELKEEFNSKEAIDNLASEAINHPNKEELNRLIERAYSIINNDFNKNQVKITLPQMGDIHGNAKRNLLMNSFGTNFITTGIVASPGEVIEVYVEANKDEPLPQIVFSQSQGHFGKWRRNYTLKPGYNKFVVPEIYDSEWPHETKPGGAIYLVNPYTSDNQTTAPVVSIEGGRKFPVFNEGDNEEEFIKELKEYKEYMDENPDTAVDIFEYNSKRVMYTGTASDAYQVYVNEGVDVATSIRVWSDFIEEGFKFAGLEDNPDNIKNDSTNLRTAIRVMQPHGSAYAASDHIGLQKHVADDFLRVDKKNINGIIWGTMHEVGHQMDIPARTWGEVTNNMWANEMAVLNDKGCRLNYNRLYSTIALNHNLDNIEFNNIDLADKLAMFWQLELYKDGYWAEIESMYREKNPTPKDYQEKKDLFAKYSSEIIGKNLTEYFERYGFTLSDECKNELSKLPDLDDKIWYINSDIMKYEGQGFNETTKASVSSKLDIENATNTLTLSINEENKNDLLGYEISKNGEVIGFTRSSSFVDSNIDINENATYDVVAYDIKLNKIDPVTIKAFTPTMKVKTDNIIVLNDEFNPLNYVKALNYKGEDVSNKVEVNHNVDTSKKGLYKIDFTLTDNDVTVKASTTVQVASKLEYASDIDWVSATSGWKNVNKDSAVNSSNKIKLKVDGEIVEFDKGIGAATNAEIVYNLEGKDYEYFTTYVGTDKNYNDNRTTIQFKILADDKEVYTSSVIRRDSDAEFVKIPLNGVKELKLIADDYDGNGIGDFASWADTKFYTNNDKPNLEIENSISTKVGQPIENLVGKYIASDTEDGDLTSKVVVSGHENINFNKPGKYTIKYEVSDSDNNTVIKERTISVVDMRDFTYLTDYEWKVATQSYGTTNKDKSVSGGSLRLTNENNEEVIYERGIGSHANATIIYDLTDKNYEYFTSFVGVDRAMYNRPGSVTFEVYVDGEKKFDSGLMNAKDAQQFVEVNISGAKELKLVVTDAKNGNGSDHASWGDSKLHFVNEEREDLSQNVEIVDENLRNAIIETLNLDKENLTIGDMYNLTSLDLESNGYVKSLKGLEYAKNLETLNINYNEITDISPLKNLKNLNNFSGVENYIFANGTKYPINGKFELENIEVIDIDGEKLVPKEIVLSPNNNPTKLDVKDVFVDDKIIIDVELVDSLSAGSVEVLYESKDTNFTLYSFFMLNNKNN